MKPYFAGSLIFLILSLIGSLFLDASLRAETGASAPPKQNARPYEMVWANRTADDHPALVDFETTPDANAPVPANGSKLSNSMDGSNGWTVESSPGVVASFDRSQEQQLFGDWVGKLVYRARPADERQGKAPVVTVRPASPILVPDNLIQDKFDAISVWVYGNRWAWETDKSTPNVQISALFADKQGELEIQLTTVNWKEWFLIYQPLNDSQKERLNQPGAAFTGFRVKNGSNESDRVLYFDSLCLFKESFPPLTFLPRPKRGLNLTDVQNPGTNTGAAPEDWIQKLPFPNRPETILPDSAAAASVNTIQSVADETAANGSEASGAGAFDLTYKGSDGKLVYRYAPKTGTWSDWTAQWNDGARLAILVNGGVEKIVDSEGKPVDVAKRELVRVQIIAGQDAQSVQTDTNKLGDGTYLESVWKLTAAPQNDADSQPSATVTYRFRVLGKSLVLDTFCPAEPGQTGRVARVQYGQFDAANLREVKILTVPYLTYAYGGQYRPAIACFRETGDSAGLFLSQLTDWYVSNASRINGLNGNDKGIVKLNGGTEYLPKTDGQRNGCFDRYFITISPNFDEVLPTIPNPISPWKPITGTKLWRAHGATTREGDKKYWRKVWRYGMRDVLVTDHEVCWRDGGESFTFRTKPAPGKGGDDGWIDYSRFMQKDLGFVYGPYNNFTDFAPVNEYWSPDRVTRTSDGRLLGAWARCYAPKPSRAIEFCAWQAPVNQKKFQFSTAYCDVHTAVTPWERTDYDSRVPGAGTFAATFYAFGEIMLRQKAAWNGPVYSEGPMHSLYSGLTDGNYAQDQGYGLPYNPWLVNFDLLKMHPHENAFGMGNPGMFYGKRAKGPTTAEGIDARADRFTCATAAFGHPGFLALDEIGMNRAWRNYFLLQQIQSRYCQTNVQSIRYVDAAGKLLTTSEAILSDDYRLSQVVVTYLDGTVIVANGSEDQRLKANVEGRYVDLPPAGWTGWFNPDGKLPSENDRLSVNGLNPNGFVESFSGDCYNGRKLEHRADYAVSPKYIFVDGRGSFVQFPAACSDKAALCRFIDDKTAEIILLDNAQAGFAIDAVSAKALDFEGNELADAEIRTSSGYAFVQPVEKAFSYRVALNAPGITAQNGASNGQRIESAIPGESVVLPKVFGNVRIPADAPSGRLFWFQEGKICFPVLVVDPFDLTPEIVDNRLNLMVRIRVNAARRLTVTLPGIGSKTIELANNPDSIFTDVQTSFDWPAAEPNWSLQTVELSLERTEPLRQVSVAPSAESATSAEHVTGSSAAKPLQQVRTLGIITERGRKSYPFNFAVKPQALAVGSAWMQLRGEQPTEDFGDTGAYVYNSQSIFSGGAAKDGLTMHPAYKGKVGRVWAEYPLTVPNADVCLRGVVGKQDGGDLGDGIWYSIVVAEQDEKNPGQMKETVVAQTSVKTYKWTPFEADLSPWKGKTVVLRLTADPGPDNNTIADHACWSELRLESKELIPICRLANHTEPILKEKLDSTQPITREQLKTAKRVSLCYCGMGLAGDSDPYITTVSINGVSLGALKGAGGDETSGIFSKEVGVSLPDEAITALEKFNRIELFNTNEDCFAIGEFRLKIELPDGSAVSSYLTPTRYTQPSGWKYATGVKIGPNDPFVVPLWLDLK